MAERGGEIEIAKVIKKQEKRKDQMGQEDLESHDS